MHKLLHILRFTWSGGYDRLVCPAKSCDLPPLPETMPAEAPCQATKGMQFYTFFNCQKQAPLPQVNLLTRHKRFHLSSYKRTITHLSTLYHPKN